MVKECQVKNSDDSSINDCVKNDIKGLIEERGSIKRLVFASGKASAKIFIKLNRDWLKEGNFWLGAGEFTQSAFSNKLHSCNRDHIPNAIELIVPYSVSPAAASVRYKAKRDQWLETVFRYNQR